MTTMSKTIKRLRTERGLSQIALAKKMKMTQSAICQAETGATTPRLATLRRLAKVLCVNVTEFLR
jgi:transcriptional regulator with XRE-family HTH domain